MLDKVLTALGEVDIGIRQALLPHIIQVIIVDKVVFVVIVITEAGIGITTANFLHITMVD